MTKPNTTVLTLPEIDSHYDQIGCLGHGGFGSVFLARKKGNSKRHVAIKAMRNLKNDDYLYESYQRELDALVTLNTRDDGTDEADHRDMAIVFLRDWFETPDQTAFLVMNYYEGGTLADHITEASTPFSERRIAWYLLQLCEALAYAHSCNVAHHDVKSENVLIDSHAGGKLVLTDFGTSVRPGQDKIGLTISYSSPELLVAHRADQSLDSINPLSVDAFGIGCIALELLLCSQLIDVTALASTTVADLSMSRTLVDTFTCLAEDSLYSPILRHQLTLRLLDPDHTNRLRPATLAKDIRGHHESPLLKPSVVASYTLDPRGHLTMDNIQLGCFVQRGPDWEGSNLDGGEGCVGVVVGLDSDALYCSVAWPTTEIFTYRIGAKCRMELAVSLPLPGNIPNGFLASTDSSKYEAGMLFHRADHSMNSMLIVKVVESGIFLVPPTSFRLANDYKSIPAMDSPPEDPILRNPAAPRDPESYPSKWGKQPELLIEVNDLEERNDVLSLFHDSVNGLPRHAFKVIAIKRVQSVRLWDAYARRRASVANENWTSPNEALLFHGTSDTLPSTILNDRTGFDPRFCDEGRFGRGSYFAVRAAYSHEFAHVFKDANNNLYYQIFIARVTLGRIQEIKGGGFTSLRRPEDGCHSVTGCSTLRNNVSSAVHVIYETSTQAFPEFLITYKATMQNRARRFR